MLAKQDKQQRSVSNQLYLDLQVFVSGSLITAYRYLTFATVLLGKRKQSELVTSEPCETATRKWCELCNSILNQRVLFSCRHSCFSVPWVSEGFFLFSLTCTWMELGRWEKSKSSSLTPSKELIMLWKKNDKPLEPRIGSVVFRSSPQPSWKGQAGAMNGDFDTRFLFVVVVVVDFVSRFFCCSY